MTAEEIALMRELLLKPDTSSIQAIWNIGAALIGALAGGVATYFVTRSLRKRDTTFALYEELNGEDMSTVRDAAYRRFIELTKDDLTAASDDPMNNIENISIWRIYRFYTKLELLRGKGELRNEHLSSLFGKLYLWWWHVLLQQGYQNSTWGGLVPLQSLYDALKKAEDNGTSKDWQGWEKHALEERIRMVKLRQAYLADTGKDGNLPREVLVSITLPAPPAKATAIVKDPSNPEGAT